jgi:phosphoglycolate phosphatase-like HAD superfamily hydrolase
MEEKQRINCVITDLDDTIWDWLKMWHSSFEPYLNNISKKCQIDLSILKEDFKRLHQKYHTSEVSFAYQELESLSENKFNEIVKKPKLGKSIIHQYYSDKKHNLELYDGVLETLKKLRSEGVMIIGYTESNAFFTKTRIKHLELDGLFDCIYTPLGAGIPSSTDRVYPEEYWEPQQTEIRHLSRFDKKPNKEILEIILEDFNLDKKHTIYVGDKLDRDVQMALDVGITSVYANYGSGIDGDKYELLKEVTHWNDEDVKREIEFKKKFSERKIVPSLELKSSYQEMLNHFEFFQSKNKLNEELIPQVVETWKKIVDVQQHFNDIALKIRNLTLTVFTFILAGIGFLIKEDTIVTLFSKQIYIEAIFSFLGALVIWIFFFMDKYWYHKYLIGSVKQGSFVENKWHKKFSELGLSNAISKASRAPSAISIFGIKIFTVSSTSNRRFKFYYRPLIATLMIMGFIFIFYNKKDITNSELYKEKADELEKFNIQNKFFENEILVLKNELEESKTKRESLESELQKARMLIEVYEEKPIKSKNQ